jgi:carbamoyl-phosphate synthase large subunit
MTRILFTGAGGAAPESIWRQWCDRYELVFGDGDASAVSPAIPRERVVQLPMANARGFAADLARICIERKADALVPGVDEELLHLDAIREAAPRLDVVAPRGELARRLLDKLACMKLLADAGLTAPRTVLGDAAAQIDGPLIVKPRSGRGSRGVMALDSPAQIAPYLQLHGTTAAQVVVQERIGGQEYTVYVSASREARLGRIVPIKVLKKKGITLRAVIEMEPRVIDYCRRLHVALRVDGPYNVQLMLDPAGRVMPFEINPRVSTTVCLALAAGADPVAAYRGEPEGAEAPPPLSLSRYWLNHIEG